MQEELARAESPQPTTQPSRSTAEVWAKHAFVPYRVGSSDVLAVALTGLDQPTTTTTYQVRVNRDGDISLPLVGVVQVGDLEMEDAERAIRSAYVPGIVKNLAVIVEVVSYDTTDVLVTGAVATPGLIPLRRNQLNGLQAVASAGGVSSAASGRITLKRVRHPGEESAFDVLDPNDLEAVFALAPLEAGDIITVEAAEPSVIYVRGLVYSPGPKLFTPGTEVSLLQILAAAGGTISSLEPKEGTLIRRMSDETDVHVKLDMRRLQSGEDPNIKLVAGDILWVPDTFETKLLAWAQQNLFFRAGMSVTANVGANYQATGIDFLNRTELQKASLTNVGGGQTLQDQFDPFGFFRP